jgi:hypothetical protein
VETAKASSVGPTELAQIRKNPNAKARRRWCVKKLALELGRTPTLAEAEARYIEWGLAWGGPDERRSSGMAEEIAYNAKHFDAKKLSAKSFERRRQELLQLVQQTVRPEHFAQVKYKARISPLDLAVGLYVAETHCFKTKVPPKWRYTLPRQAIEGMFAKLRAEGLIDRGCDHTKAGCIRRLLAAAGLLYRIEGHQFGGRKNGVGEKWGIGAVHPRRHQFELLLTQQPPVLLT